MILNCTDNQVENLFIPPTRVWINPNGTTVPSDGESNPRMDPHTRQLVFNDINHNDSGSYLCRSIINIPQAQIISYMDEATITINTNGTVLLKFIDLILYTLHDITVPGVVQNLKCARSSSQTELLLSWEPPTMISNEMVSYQVTVNRLEHSPGTRNLIQFEVYNHFNIEVNQTIINQGLGTKHIHKK